MQAHVAAGQSYCTVEELFLLSLKHSKRTVLGVVVNSFILTNRGALNIRQQR